MLNGIYYTEENPMDVVNVALQKGKEPRKNKKVSNVQTEEVQEQRGKSIRQSNQVPRNVTKSLSRPSLGLMLLLFVRVKN